MFKLGLSPGGYPAPAFALGALFWLLMALFNEALADDPRCPAIGGDFTLTTVDGELSCIHTFTDEGSDTFAVPVGDLVVELMVVGGGGAGGQAAGGGGGGGAGGLLYNASLSVTGSVAVSVGAGGSGVGTGGQNGQDSSFGDQVALGGGGGAPADELAGRDGGSGGGGSGGDKGVAIDTEGTALQLPEFGEDGGVGGVDKKIEKQAGGGGGGASDRGAKADAKKEGGLGGAGGPGLCAGGSVLPQWMDVVASGCFAGGGGGTSHEISTDVDRAGAGGIGGGGQGEEPTVGGVNDFAEAGLANTGGGGGAARNGPPGAGGSGAVLVRYRAASQLQVASGNNQVGVVNESLAIGPAVLITDNAGNPIGGVAVSFSVASGDGTIVPTDPIVTNASGVAQLTSWTLGTVAGEQTLTATVTDLTGSPLTFTATATPGAPTRLGIKTQPASFVVNGEAFPTQPEIQLFDTWGNVVTESGIEVTASLESGDGVLAGNTTAITNDLGIAVFSDLAVIGRVGPRIIQFDSASTSTISSNTFTVQAGAPTGLVMTQEPSSLAQSAVVLAEQPSVGLIDQSGNRVSEAGVSVSVSLDSGNPSGVLGGTLSALTDASGVASFSDLVITGPVDDYGLGFASTGLTGVSSELIAISAGPPTTLVITQQPSAEARNGFVFDQQPIIQLQDSAGNPTAVAGVVVTVEMGEGSGSVGGTTSVATNESGQAVFNDLLIEGQVGIATLRFTATDYASVTSTPIELSCGECEKLAVIIEPVDTVVGEAIPVAPVVGQFDGAGNPTTIPLEITVALAFGPGTLSGTLTKTSINGEAVFDDLVIEGQTGPYAFTFTSEPLASAQSNVFEVLAGDPNAMSLEAGDNQTAVVGNPVATAPSVRVRDAWGNPVAGVQLDFEVSEGGGSVSPTSVVTNADGLAEISEWTLGTTAGSQTLEATSADLPGQTITWSATATAGAPTQLQALLGNDQTTAAGTAVTVAPMVLVSDQFGNPVSDIAVQFDVIQGNGRIIGADTQTNVQGQATVGQWILDTTPGDNALRARAVDLSLPAVVFDATGVVGPAAQLVIVTQPVAAGSGEALITQPVVSITDQFGNLTDSTETIEATLVFEDGGTPPGTLAGIKRVAAIDGLVTFSGLVLTGLATTGYELEFSNTNLSTATSEMMTLLAGAASQLRITQQPSAFVTNAESFSVQPVIQLLDGYGNHVSEAGVMVTAEIGAGGGTLSGTTSVLTNATGRAMFSDLAIEGWIGPRQLVFRATGLSAATSNTLTLQAGDAVGLVMTQEPSSLAQSAVVLAEQPSVGLIDQSGNRVSEAGVSVGVSLDSGDPSGVLGGTLSALTDASGVASFSDLVITGPVDDYGLGFASTGLTGVSSELIAISAGPPTTLVITQQPSAEARNGFVFDQQPIIQLQDSAGNPALISGVGVSVSIGAGDGVLGGATTVLSDAQGRAVFTDLLIEGQVGTKTLRFTASGYSSVTSSDINLICGRCEKLAMITQPVGASAGQVLPVSPVVGQFDGAGNPTTTPRVITASLAFGAGTLSGTTAKTSSNGQAIFDDLVIEGTAGPYALIFSSEPLAATQSDVFELQAGTPNVLSVEAGNNQSAVVGKAVAIAPSARVVDAWSNSVSGITVDFAVTGGGGSVAPASAVTNASGIATVSSWTLGTVAGANTLQATSASVSGQSITWSASAMAGAPTQLRVVTGDGQTAAAGTAVPVAPTVEVLDAFNNPVSDVTVEFAVTSGGGSVIGASRQTNAQGQASVGQWTLGTATGSNTLSATATGISVPAAIVSADAVAGAATQLQLSQQPSAFVTHGEPFDVQPIVQLLDQYGNATGDEGVDVRVSLASGEGSLAGAQSVSTNAAGKAIFTDLELTGPVGQHTLNFAASALTSVVSNTITLKAGQASGLQVVQEPSSQVQSGVLLAEQPKIQVVDASGNAVGKAGVSVTVSLTSLDSFSALMGASEKPKPQATASLSGTTTVETDDSGLASFTDLVITGTVGGYRLAFQADGLTESMGDTIEVNAGPPQQLIIAQAPSDSSRQDEVFARQPIIALQDSAGNAAPVAGVVITVSIGSGGPSLEGATTAVTDAQGLARFTDLKVKGVVGERTLRFVSDDYGSVTSDAFEITCGRCAKLAMDVQPADAISGEVLPVAPVVGQYDNAGNRTSTPRPVTVNLDSGPGTLSGTLTKTSSNGQVTFDDLVIEGAAGTYILSFNSPNLAGVSSDAFSLTVPEVFYDVTPVSIPANGGEVVCDPNPVLRGETTRCRAIPNPQFEFEAWSACPGEVIDEMCEIAQVRQEESVSARFVLRPLPVSAISIWTAWLLVILAWWFGLELITRRQRHLGALDNAKGGT